MFDQIIIPGSPNARTSSTGSTNSSILERALGSNGKDGGCPASPPPPMPPPPPHSLPADHFQWPPQNFGPDGGGNGMEDYIKQEMNSGGGEGGGGGPADYMGHFHSSPAAAGPAGMMPPHPPHLHPPHGLHPHQLHHAAQQQEHHGHVIAPDPAAAAMGQYPPQDMSHPPWVR